MKARTTEEAIFNVRQSRFPQLTAAGGAAGRIGRVVGRTEMRRSWLHNRRLRHLIRLGVKTRHNHRAGVGAMVHWRCRARRRRRDGQIIVVNRMGWWVGMFCYLSFWTTRTTVWWVTWWRWGGGCRRWRTQNSWKEWQKVVSNTWHGDNDQLTLT